MCVCPQGGAIPACNAGGIPACLAAGLVGAIPACIASGFPACLAAGLQGGGSGPGPHPRGKSRGICPGWCMLQGGACSGGVPGGDPLPDGYCCGRYTSYWNAFLLKLLALLNHDKTLNICFPNLLPLFFGNIHIGTLNYCSSKQSSHSMLHKKPQWN